MKAKIQDIMQRIATEELDRGGQSQHNATYKDQRLLINQVFQSGDYSKGSILMRLVVINSMYSTSAEFYYFSFEDMAEAIWKLGTTPKAANDYFYSIVTQKKDPKGLFAQKFGMSKDCREGAYQISLLSKYAYYCLMQDIRQYPLGFPIYDRLAKEMYARVCRWLGVKPDSLSVQKSDKMTIERYVTALWKLRDALFDNKALYEGYQQFDILDAYLWRMGKFSEGNLSLLLSKTDYEQFIDNLGLKVYGLAAKKEEGKSVKSLADLIKARLHDEAREPFAGVSNETYMKTLLAHCQEILKQPTTKPKVLAYPKQNSKTQ